MVNRINAHQVAQQVAQLYTQRAQSVGNTHAAGIHKRPPSSRDEVELSPEARALQKFAEAAANTPDMDKARVEALRQQVQTGTYRVPVDKLVNKLLEQLYQGKGG